MGYFRRHFFPLTLIVLAAFLAVMTAESFHHHEKAGTSEQDCSLCSWQLNSSHAVTTFVTPFIAFIALFFFTLHTFIPSYFHTIFLSIPGRSPPPILL